GYAYYVIYSLAPRRPPLPYTTLFRSQRDPLVGRHLVRNGQGGPIGAVRGWKAGERQQDKADQDAKTRTHFGFPSGAPTPVNPRRRLSTKSDPAATAWQPVPWRA